MAVDEGVDAGGGAPADNEEFSIDELARRAGSNVRNVRLYQERGLLPPPRRVGRSNWYGAEHLARLNLILAMLGKGYPLAAIRELLEAWQGQRSLADILGFEEMVSAPFVEEEPRHYTADEIVELFPGDEPDDVERMLDRAAKLELLIPDGDGFLAPIPSLVEAGAQLVADGVPVSAVLDVAQSVNHTADKLAKTFVDMFVRHVWEPFVRDGMPPERLPLITDALERQRPLATKAVVPALAQALQRRVEKVASEHAATLAKSSRSKGRPRR